MDFHWRNLWSNNFLKPFLGYLWSQRKDCLDHSQKVVIAGSWVGTEQKLCSEERPCVKIYPQIIIWLQPHTHILGQSVFNGFVSSLHTEAKYLHKQKRFPHFYFFPGMTLNKLQNSIPVFPCKPLWFQKPSQECTFNFSWNFL